MRKKILSVELLIIIIISLVSFSKFVPSAHGTVITPPTTVWIDKEQSGHADSEGRWVEGYWVFTVAVDEADEFMGYTVLEAEEKIPYGTIHLTRKENVKIQITPKKAYLTKGIKDASVLVTPKTYGAWQGKILKTSGYRFDDWCPSLSSGHYEWEDLTEPWAKWTEFVVEVFVGGEKVGDKTLDTKGGSQTLIVDTNKGEVRVKKLGTLRGTYGDPPVDDYVFFGRDYIFKKDQVIDLIRYDGDASLGATYWNLYELEGAKESYSCYWFGDDFRWNGEVLKDKGYPSGEADALDKTPAGFEWTWFAQLIDANEYGGWLDASTALTYDVIPLEPVIFVDEKESKYPSDSDFWDLEPHKQCCLVEYLESVRERKEHHELFTHYDGWTLDVDNNQVVVDVPWGDYSGSPIVTVFVPTELADTWVYKEPVADLRVESVEWLGGGTFTKIHGTKSCRLTVKQHGEGSGIIRASSSIPEARVKPTERTVTLTNGEVKTYSFNVENLGVDVKKRGKVQFELLTMWEEQTDYDDTLEFELQPKSLDWTKLYVLVVDAETQDGVGGISVYCEYGEDSKQGITASDGEIFFDLGLFRGEVKVVTGETAKYKSAWDTTYAEGTTEMTIELHKHGEEPEFPWEWILVSLVVVCVSVAGYSAYKMSKRGRKRR